MSQATTGASQIRVAIPLFDKMTALDAIGPYEVLQREPTIDVTFVGARRGEIRTENAMLGLTVDATYAELPDPDVIVFPGGNGTRQLRTDTNVLDWLRSAHISSRFTTSVCTGALVLAEAGLLDGLTATTHFAALPTLAELGVQPTSQRIVEHVDQRVITAAGVSAGIDMALKLLELLVDDTAAQAAQLLIEYDPQPPFDAGAPAKASPDVIERAREYRVRV